MAEVRLEIARQERVASLLLAGLVFIYAALAGFRTVADFDLGWQMAASRHPLSAADTLSYTVPGSLWIYPSLSGLIFRGLFALGGYAAISWFCAAVMLATVAIVVVRSRPAVSVVVIIAVPALARQMIPRSGLFTVVLSAAMVRVLLDHQRGSRGGRLWLLPLIMILWANLHTGFIAGLALMLGYVAAETVDFIFRPAMRPQIRLGLRRALPWLACAAMATVVNPWGWRMYAAVAALEHPSHFQSSVVLELTPLYRDWHAATLNPLDPASSIWWMLIVSALAIPLLLWRRQAGRALLLAAAMVACLLSARDQGVFLPLACLIAGEEIFADLGPPLRLSVWRPALVWSAMLAAVVLVSIDCAAIVTNRSSVHEDQITSFGAGASWWLPRKAAEFIEQHHLPTELFAPFNLSSYVSWSLGAHYRDFADGRYLPFGDRLVSEQISLTSLPLDSRRWVEASTRWDIRTVILPLARFYGIQTIPLRADCASSHWTPVYLDTTAIVLVRNDALPQAELTALRIDCQRQPLAAAGSRIDSYEQLANAAVILYSLGRNDEAQHALTRAQALFANDDSLLLLAGELQTERGDLDGAEQSVQRARALHASDSAWYQIGFLAARRQDYPAAIDAFQRALTLEEQPSFVIEEALARAQLLSGREEDALETTHRATGLASNTPAPSIARAELDDIEAAAQAQLLHWPAAIAAEEDAVQQTPGAAQRWQALATLYAADGQGDRAAQALERAHTLANTTP